MTTSLGGNPQGVRLHVKNSSTTTALKRGTIVSWSSVAASNPAALFLDLTRNKDYGTGTMRELDVPYIVVTTAGADSASAGGAGRLGVVAADIPANGYGEIICFGLCRVLFGGIVAVGDHFSSNASGLGIDSAATDRNTVGIALEAGAANTLSWAFINTMMHGGHSAAFWGGKAVA